MRNVALTDWESGHETFVYRAQGGGLFILGDAVLRMKRVRYDDDDDDDDDKCCIICDRDDSSLAYIAPVYVFL